MRQIKFRAWDKIDKEMLYPKWEEDYVGGGNKKIGLYIYRSKNHPPGHSSLDWILKHPESFIPEQFTGLKDKAGVESYRDDIYHLKDFTDEYIMLWDDTGAYFYLKGIHGGEVKSASVVSTGTKIGNIHSNPELIEKGTK